MIRSNCVIEDGRHYELIAPYRIKYYGSWEPPEGGCDWALVIAKNKSEARKKVLTESVFRDYVTEMRGDRKPPWYEVKTIESVCEHRICWGCGFECQECIKEPSL